MSAENSEIIATGGSLGQDLGTMAEQSGIAILREVSPGQSENESYTQLVWRRFRRSKVSIVGGFMVITLIFLAIFADFFSPTSIYGVDLQSSFIPPQQVHFFTDANGQFHIGPYVYNMIYSLNPKTFQVQWIEDTKKAYDIHFFVQGPEYKLLGFIPMNLHFFGVEPGGNLHIL